MLTSEQTLKTPILPTWCPGCGNFAIMAVMKRVLASMGVPEEDVVVVYGIGCGGNGADFTRTYALHALHGRAVANAVGIKLANHKLRVIVMAGDGDLYGEGLNHLIASARGNHDITVVVHDNQMYSLTTGQSSPTTKQGTKTRSTPDGVIETEINPLALSLVAGATFVARAYAGLAQHMLEIFTKAIEHPGFSIVDVLQPCPTFNKTMSYQWYQQHIYDLAKTDHDTNNKQHALSITLDEEKLPIGVLYQQLQSVAYHSRVMQLNQQPLLAQFPKKIDLALAMQQFE